METIGAGEFLQSHKETLNQSWSTLGGIARIGGLMGQSHKDGFQDAARTPGIIPLWRKHLGWAALCCPEVKKSKIRTEVTLPVILAS